MAIDEEARLHESSGVLRLPIVGGEVDQLCIDFAFSLVIDGTHTVRMSTPISYTNGSGTLDIEPSDTGAIHPLLGLHQAIVTEAWASAEGVLHLAFSDNRTIVVAPSEDYEAWEVAGGLPPVSPVYSAVCLPGGGVATF